MAKYYNTISSRQFTKTLNQFLYLSRAKENLETWMPILFEKLNESKRFWGTFTGYVFENAKYNLCRKLQYLSKKIFTWVASAKLPKKFYFEFSDALNFPYFWNKNARARSCLWNIATFQRNIVYMVSSFVVFFFIRCCWMFNILVDMIKFLQEKILKAISFYWFHNDAWEKITH